VIALSPGQIPPGVVALTRGVAPTMLQPSRILTAVACGGLALGAIGLAAWTKAHAVAAEAPGDDPDRLRVVSIDHMKAIVIALHTHQPPSTRSPPAATAGPAGTPLLSWRVMILPYLDQQALYGQFHLDEPWDSPHNKTLIDKMPNIFATPSSPAG